MIFLYNYYTYYSMQSVRIPGNPSTGLSHTQSSSTQTIIHQWTITQQNDTDTDRGDRWLTPIQQRQERVMRQARGKHSEH